MNHRKTYDRIVEHYKLHPPVDGVNERHHIIPRSCGGNDDESNIVLLPLRAHFICHILLVKLYEGERRRKMVFALRCMMNNDDHRITSKQYETFKIEHSRMVSEQQNERIARGDHPFLDSEATSRRNKKLVAEGRHNFQGPEVNRKRIEAGTHNFLDREAASQRAKKRLRDGDHHFLDSDHQRKAAKACLEKGRHNFQSPNINKRRWARWRRDNGKEPLPGDELWLTD